MKTLSEILQQQPIYLNDWADGGKINLISDFEGEYMTKEEYEDCVGKLETGTLIEKFQASFLLSLLPTYESKIPINEAFKVGQDPLVKDSLEKLVNDRP